MRISALALDGNRGWPDLQFDSVAEGLNVLVGPPNTGKTTMADLVAHALYGRQPAVAPEALRVVLPEGQIVVDCDGERYRLRRYQNGTSAGRLTVAALDGSRVDPTAVRDLLHGLSPSLVARMFAVNFRKPPAVQSLLTAEWARQFLPTNGLTPSEHTARTTALLARRDALAEELQARIADRRRTSRELDDEWRELDSLTRRQQQELVSLRDRLRTVDTALAETDARLRYRRLESTVDQQWSSESVDYEPQLAELDHEVAHWRATLADLESREESLRARLARIDPGTTAAATLIDGRAWLAVARQLATDLQGEVSRLARANASQQCVCGDAHPRLRPIVETFSRQLEVLDSVLNQQQQASDAAALHTEIEHVVRSQAQLRHQLEFLLDRRETLVRGGRPGRRPTKETEHDDVLNRGLHFTAADAEQLELRRAELEQERYGLCSRLADFEPQLNDLCQRRDAVDRQRATQLSTRAIDDLQRDLAAVERELEAAAGALPAQQWAGAAADWIVRVSEFLAQLTDGELLRVERSANGQALTIIDRAGHTVPLTEITAAERDQLVLSCSLASVAACTDRGLRLPLILDEPFLRLDQRDTAALVAVLDDLGRRGSQILVFTGQVSAAQRFESLGAPVRDMRSLRREARGNSSRIEPSTNHFGVDSPPRIGQSTKSVAAGHSSDDQSSPSGNRTGRFFLDPTSHVGQSPSIGPKTAQRLANAGIHTVADLLAADPIDAARRLAARHVKADTIRSWQRQARLACQVPQLRPQDAQLLVGCGLSRAEQIAEMQPEELLEMVTLFCNTQPGERILRSRRQPDLARVARWIASAGRRREVNAA